MANIPLAIGALLNIAGNSLGVAVGTGSMSNMRIRRYPLGSAANPSVATAGVSIVAAATPTFSAWTQIVAAAVITNPTWLCGVNIDTIANVGASETWLVDVAAGAGGAEISFSTGLINQGTLATFATYYGSNAGQSIAPATYNLPRLLKITGAPRISMAVAGTITGGKAATCSFMTIDGVGT